MLNKIIFWLVLLVGGFLAGFLQPHMKLVRLEDESASVRKQLDVCQATQQLSQLRETATMMYLEATRKNYGTSAEYSTKFFQNAQQTFTSTADPALQNVLREILALRDQITADLAKGDPAAVNDIQPVLVKLEQGLK